MKGARTYLRRLNTPGLAPGLQSWALAVLFGFVLGTGYQVDAIAAQLPAAATYGLQLVTDAPTWAYLVAGFVVVALLVIVPTLRAFRSAPLDPEVWTDSQLRTLREMEERPKVVILAERRAVDRGY